MNSRYQNFANSVKQSTRYVRSEEELAFLESLVLVANERQFILETNNVLWRAQLGADQNEGGVGESIEPFPYSPMRMFPDIKYAREGRANPKGVPYLYVASDMQTAISETRPWIGKYVSVAKLMAKHPLKLADFSLPDGLNYYNVGLFEFNCSDLTSKEQNFLHVARAFSLPVINDDTNTAYIPTQIISEFIRKKGYDGLLYNSAFGSGFNIVIFERDAVDVVSCQVCVPLTFSMEIMETRASYVKKDNNYYRGCTEHKSNGNFMQLGYVDQKSILDSKISYEKLSQKFNIFESNEYSIPQDDIAKLFHELERLEL